MAIWNALSIILFAAHFSVMYNLYNIYANSMICNIVFNLLFCSIYPFFWYFGYLKILFSLIPRDITEFITGTWFASFISYVWNYITWKNISMLIFIIFTFITYCNKYQWKFVQCIITLNYIMSLYFFNLLFKWNLFCILYLFIIALRIFHYLLGCSSC